tara:strand:- start:1214 stop:2437 length:1224 start_codon:yes stop_codon:yes gene_type:complete
MNIFKKFINSNKLKRFRNNFKEYRYYVEDSIFYSFVFFFTINQKEKRLKIITASDSKFYDSLIQLIDSIRTFEPDAKIVLYDIGLNNSQIEKLKNYKLFEFKKFDFNKYPQFFSDRDEFGKLGAYAWKSAIINEVLENETKDIVIWFDAGNILTGKLTKLKKVILFNSFYSPLSAGNLKDWCHFKTLSFLNAGNNILKKPNLTGGLVGFNSSTSQAKEFAKKWFKYSLIKECISPEGSDRNNHRQDQSVLSILFYLDKKINYSPKTKSFFSIKVNQNPGKRIYLLDSSEKSEFKITWLKKQDDITTNTVSSSDAIWILDLNDLKKLEKKYLTRHKIIFNIFSNEDLSYLLENKYFQNQNSKTYFLIYSLDILNKIIEDDYLSEKIYKIDDTKDLNQLRNTINTILSD